PLTGEARADPGPGRSRARVGGAPEHAGKATRQLDVAASTWAADAGARSEAQGGDRGGAPRMTDLRCTYRLQLRPHLDFRKARELVPYLRDLGVSHLYLSPSMEARAGSTHGYDVVDPTTLASDLGGEEEFRALCESDLGVILDVVPNHMAASEEENPFWRDPLTRAKFFDVEGRTGGVRRFFDISDLAGVRVEDPEVFEVTHRKVIQLVRE